MSLHSERQRQQHINNTKIKIANLETEYPELKGLNLEPIYKDRNVYLRNIATEIGITVDNKTTRFANTFKIKGKYIGYFSLSEYIYLHRHLRKLETMKLQPHRSKMPKEGVGLHSHEPVYKPDYARDENSRPRNWIATILNKLKTEYNSKQNP